MCGPSAKYADKPEAPSRVTSITTCSIFVGPPSMGTTERITVLPPEYAADLLIIGGGAGLEAFSLSLTKPRYFSLQFVYAIV